MGFWNPKKHYLNQVGFEQQEPPKRISTSAGHRLSVILENGSSESQTGKAREAHRDSVRRVGLNPILAEVPEDKRTVSAHSSGYSYNVWSENEKFAAIRNYKQITKRGGWKKLLIILAIIILFIIALGVGLGLGLKKNKAESPSPAAANASPAASTPPSPPTATSTTPAPSQPSNFPLGSYSFITFLDTIQTNCTTNPLTWTCYPYTTYYTDTSKALSLFDWVISGTPDAYKISSSTNPFGTTFKNAPLELLDEGKPTERYKFQVSQTKTVAPSANITDDNADVECDFADTNFQAVLYTKMEKEYPSEREPSGDPKFATWPYAVRIEQSAAGGRNVPACYKTGENGQHGAQVKDGLEAQDAGTLCSCLYKNWHTPS